MPFLEDGQNEYGTPVSRFKCETCGDKFTICPVVVPDKHGDWSDCLATQCDSYDPNRDADLFFDDPEYWRISHGDAVPRRIEA